MSVNDRKPAFELPETLNGKSANLARAAWILLAVFLVPLTTWGLVRIYQNPELLDLGPLKTLFSQLGVDPRTMMMLALALPFYAVVAISSYVFVSRPKDPVALMFSAALLVFFSAASRAFQTFEDFAVMQYADDVVLFLMGLSLIVLFGLFPNGKLTPQWAWVMGPLLLFAFVLNPQMSTTILTVMEGRSAISPRELLAITTVAVGVLGIGLFAQIYRYRHISTAEQRQQTKLVTAPLGLFLCLLMTALVAYSLNPNDPGAWIGWAFLASLPAAFATPMGIAAAVLRYRLFEVDRLISRTVTYTLVVITLGLVFALGVVGIPTLLGLGEASPILVAASTLAVAALFNPLRKRLQRAVDRRFNRTSYRSEQVSAELAKQIQGTLTVSQLTNTWAETVDAYFEPAASGVWIKVPAEPTD